MKRLNVLQSDQLEVTLYNEYREIDKKGNNLFEKDRIMYWPRARSHAERRRIEIIYEFPLNCRDDKWQKRGKK